jgi:hypothetical protein
MGREGRREDRGERGEERNDHAGAMMRRGKHIYQGKRQTREREREREL